MPPSSLLVQNQVDGFVHVANNIMSSLKQARKAIIPTVKKDRAPQAERPKKFFKT
jgi:hypothetical protein